MRLNTFFLLALATPSLALAKPPVVVTDMPVVQSLVVQVMGDLGTASVLLEQGADVHSFQLKPSQAAEIAKADLVIWVGHDLTPWLTDTIDGIGIKGRSVELLDAEGLETRTYGQEHEGEEHAHDHPEHDETAPGDTAQEDAGEEEAPHQHSGTDPHVWLDPSNAKVWVDAIAAALGSADPDNAATYAANATTAKTGIDAIEAEVTATLAPVGDTPIVVYHDAYGYFSAHFGVNIVGEVELGDASAPSAAKLADLRATLKADGAACIFPETQHDPKLLISVTDGIGIRLGAAIDPEGTSLTYGAGLYGALMTTLATAIADCVTAK